MTADSKKTKSGASKIKKKILLIDDEPDVLQILRKRLEMYGFEIATATSGLEGIEVAKQWSPDMIVLDQMMPKMKGVEVCRLLKKDKETSVIPVIFFTAHVREGFEKECIKAGALGIIYKPTVNELLELMNKIIKGTPFKWGQEEDMIQKGS